MQGVVFAILLMSSASAEAMEFGDRPGMVAGQSSPAVDHTTASIDRLRRQVDAPAHVKISGSKLADRRRPISNGVHTHLATLTKDGPGRLSPEFSAVYESSHIRLDPRHALSIPRKPKVTIVSMRFEDRPANRVAAVVSDRPVTDQVSSPFKFAAATIALRFENALAVGDVRFADRIVTSSMSMAPDARMQTSSLDFCIGSIAPCDEVRFAQNQPIAPPSIWIRHYVSH